MTAVADFEHLVPDTMLSIVEDVLGKRLSGVAIPAEVRSVMVEARDLLGGWSGQTHLVELPT